MQDIVPCKLGQVLRGQRGVWVDGPEEVQERGEVGLFVLEEDGGARVEGVDCSCEGVEAGGGEEGFPEGAQGEEQGLRCGGVLVDVLCAGGGCVGGGLCGFLLLEEEGGVFVEDRGEEGFLGDWIEEPMSRRVVSW